MAGGPRGILAILHGILLNTEQTESCSLGRACYQVSPGEARRSVTGLEGR